MRLIVCFFVYLKWDQGNHRSLPLKQKMWPNLHMDELIAGTWQTTWFLYLQDFLGHLDFLNKSELYSGFARSVEQRQDSHFHLFARIFTGLIGFISVIVEERGHFSADIRSTDLYLGGVFSEIVSLQTYVKLHSFTWRSEGTKARCSCIVSSLLSSAREDITVLWNEPDRVTSVILHSSSFQDNSSLQGVLSKFSRWRMS